MWCALMSLITDWGREEVFGTCWGCGHETGWNHCIGWSDGRFSWAKSFIRQWAKFNAIPRGSGRSTHQWRCRSSAWRRWLGRSGRWPNRHDAAPDQTYRAGNRRWLGVCSWEAHRNSWQHLSAVTSETTLLLWKAMQRKSMPAPTKWPDSRTA